MHSCRNATALLLVSWESKASAPQRLILSSADVIGM